MILKDKRITFIGAGNMGEALIRGLLAAHVVFPDQLCVTDIRQDRLEFFANTFGIHTSAENTDAVTTAHVVLLAVKPQQINDVLISIKKHLTNNPLLISIAAGISTQHIERLLATNPRVIRSMPNTPAFVREAATALCKGAYATDADLTVAESILGSVGLTVKTQESLLDAVTALSGSGPAYIFFIAETMIKTAISMGLAEDVATQLTNQTILGAGKLLIDSKESPEVLRNKVTSPGGTTEAAINFLSDQYLPQILEGAIRRAAQRSQELANQ